MTNEQIKEAVEEAQAPLLERLDALDARMGDVSRQRTIAVLTAALSLVVAIVAIVYALNRESALQEQISTNALVVCSQARTTTVGYRKPLPKETQDDFIERMISQKLYLVASAGLECSKLPGFDTFPFLRARALAEINDILRRLAPRRLQKEEAEVDVSALLGAPVRPSGTSLATELPSSSPAADEGGSNEGPGSPGGKGDSTGGPGNPSPPDQPPAKSPSGQDQEDGSGPPASSGSPPPTDDGGEDAGEDEGSTDEGGESVLAPAVEQTCTFPLVSSLLCTPR